MNDQVKHSDESQAKGEVPFCCDGQSSISLMLAKSGHIVGESSSLNVVDKDGAIKKCPLCGHLSIKLEQLRKKPLGLVQNIFKHESIPHMCEDPPCFARRADRDDVAGLLVQHVVEVKREKKSDSEETSVILAPKPQVRRLVGKQAKQIGQKIDGSNLHFVLRDYGS